LLLVLQSSVDTDIRWRSFKPVPVESLGVVSYSPSIVTMALSCITCKIEWDIGRKSVKICISCCKKFSTTLLWITMYTMSQKSSTPNSWW